KVRETIEALTDEVCKTEKNIVDRPIVLNVYSQTCPDLTLVDLPGVTRVPVGNQPKNIEEITKNMATRYCQDPLTIILCVIAANSDIATSDGLKLAKEIDVNGSRTIGVLTKLDIMDKGTDARKALMNEEIELRLGYVGVKNRSKQDLIDKIPMALAIKKEKEFFQNHPIYKTLPPGHYGTDVLIQKLTKVLFKVIRENLPKIIKSINENMKKCEEELQMYGDGVPVDDAGKLSLLWNMLNEFCEMYKNVLQGKFDNKRLDFLEDEGGYKIKEHFKTLLDGYTGDYRATGTYTDDYINYALTIHEGDSIPGFPSVDAFFFLLKPLLEVLKEPINECFQNIYSYLELIAEKVMERTFQRFPRLIKDLGVLIKGFLTQERDKTKNIIDSILDMEINSLFTNDYDYMTNYTSFVPKTEQDKSKPGLPQPVDSRSIFIKEIRNRIEAYFKLIVRNLRAAIPKTIGYNLVKSVEENMQMDLYNKLYNNKEIVHSLDEEEHIMIRRKELHRQIKVLRDAQKVIKRDPDLMSSMSIMISEDDIIGMESKPSHAQSQPQPSNPQPVQNQAPHTEANKPANMGNVFGGQK
ncbi:MAG: dynamin family protein, partial [archaeon]|nr:dynamin family protein [archaeon]